MKIGVVGAGVMGQGVSERLAQYGIEVILVDLNTDILNKALNTLERNIRISNMFSKEKKVQDVNEVLGKIKCSVYYTDLEDVDIVVENISEIAHIKEEVYKKLDAVCKTECVYLVNTSCLSITRIGSFTNRPDRVIGTHFMNPVPVKKAAEVIKGYHTSEETLNKVDSFLKSIDIEPIIINDFPGFVSNRISHLLMNEAAYVLQDGIATAEQVDAIFEKCFEHKMGPLATADLIGLDTVVNSLDVLYESYQDPKFRVCPLLRKMVYAGLYGRKSGQGFYEY